MNSYNAILDEDEPRTLCDWVKNFRIKKIQMKRKLRSGGDLRICAILSTALLSAEHELRRKQQERFSRWLEMQSKFDKTVMNSSRVRSCSAEASVTSVSCNMMDATPDYKQRDEISNIWKCELNSLDEFMRNIGSKSKSVMMKNEMLLIQNGEKYDKNNCSSSMTTTSTSIEVAS